MKKLLILIIAAVCQLFLPYYAFAEILTFDFEDDGTFETKWYLDPTINETVKVAIWFDGYTATTDLLGIQCRFTYDESKVQVNESDSYCYDLEHGCPWLLSYLDNLGDGTYEIAVLAIGCVPVYEGKIKIAVLELQGLAEDYAGSQIVANPWWGDGIKDCNNDDVYPVYDTLAKIFQFAEIDDDGIPDSQDNCSNTPNGPVFGTCSSGNTGIICMNNSECDLGEIEGFCSMNQEDSDEDALGDVCDNCPNHYNPNQEDELPFPDGNGIPDACDCEGNFDCDADCDGTDAAKFKADFGRSIFDNPCGTYNPCNGDFDCDHDCDGTDAALFKEDFGRSSFNNPCPSCEVDNWCNYDLCDGPEDCDKAYCCGQTLTEPLFRCHPISNDVYCLCNSGADCGYSPENLCCCETCPEVPGSLCLYPTACVAGCQSTCLP